MDVYALIFFTHIDYFPFCDLSVYTGNPGTGSQTGLRLDRRVVRHELGRRAAIRAENADRDEREGKTEESTDRRSEATGHADHVRADHTDGQVAHSVEIVVFLVVAVII